MLVQGQTFTAGERGSAPGAIDDARPDCWGERIIRHVDRHARLSMRLGLDGYCELTPAYDVVPTVQNLGYQAMSVGKAAAESSLENALTELNEFGIRRARAMELIRQVARVVDDWQAH